MLLPEKFTERIKNEFEGEAEAFLNSLQEEVPVSFRLNRLKFPFEKIDCKSVNWCSDGYYISQRPAFTMDPLFHSGGYYVQEASSMFLEQAFRQLLYTEQTPMVLDLCAAPGGKSTHLLSLMQGKGMLFSNEVIRSRAQILAENVTKWGYSNVVVTSSDSRNYGALTSFFDMILVDAPCSGEGMFRKDDRAVEEWSEENVNLCAERQRRIVSDVFPALKDGGLLIYSTCTFNKKENDENTAWIAESLGAEIVHIEVKDDWGITATECGYHFYPHKAKGEGFYLAALRKVGGDSPIRLRQTKRKNSEPVPKEIESMVKSGSDIKFIPLRGSFVALPTRYADVVKCVADELNIIQAGTTIGCMKGKDAIPDVSLALSLLLPDNFFPIIDLDWNQAIAYLRKDNVTLDSYIPKGWIVVSFKGAHLGFLKNLGNRTNNPYPQEWRIRMDADSERYKPILYFF